MLNRLVKLTLREEKANDFLVLFKEVKGKIKAFEGCLHLELWQCSDEKNIFFTFSIWKDKTYLDLYRKSNLFAKTWKNAKLCFAEKAEVWSSIKVEND